MASTLDSSLAELTGEELYHLITAMDSAITDICLAPAKRKLSEDEVQALNRVVIDQLDLATVVRRQVARITVPIREAAALVVRAQYSRHHPVRVPGTL